MKIDKVLQQTNFYSEHHKLRVNLLYSANWLEEHIRSFLVPFDITQKQFNILRILRGQYPQSLSILEVRNRMIDKMSDASRIIERLHKKGLITKESCATDKRQTDVCITLKGLDILTRIDQSIQKLDSITSELSTEEAQQLNYLLDKMRMLSTIYFYGK